jgi:hypothetical protein
MHSEAALVKYLDLRSRRGIFAGPTSEARQAGSMQTFLRSPKSQIMPTLERAGAPRGA